MLSDLKNKYSTAINKSGLVKEHALEIAKIAEQEKSFFLFRPVNEKSTNLIRSNYPTKGLGMKPKSSDWGPHAGFICTDSNLSKLIGMEDKLEENTLKIKTILTNQNAFETPLLLTKERLIELVENNVIQCANESSNSLINFLTQPYVGKKEGKVIKNYLFIFKSVTKKIFEECHWNQLEKSSYFCRTEKEEFSERDKYLFMTQFNTIQSDYEERFIVYYKNIDQEKDDRLKNYEPLLVFAKSTGKGDSLPKKKIMEEGYFLPFTSDYDIFAIYPKLSRYSNNYLLEKKHLENEELSPKDKFKAAVHTVIDATGGRQRRFIHEDLDKMSYFSVKIKRLINESIKKNCRYIGGDVIQHGAEVDNRSGVNIDFPVTVFTPLGRIISVENKLRLQMIISEIKMLGYVVYVNLRWKDKNYTNAMELTKNIIEKKGETEKHPELFIESFTDFNLNYNINMNQNKSENNSDNMIKNKIENLFLILEEEFLLLKEAEKMEILNCIQ